jgi:hypothetical protein
MNRISARCSSLVGGLLLCTLCCRAIDRDMQLPRPAGLEKITLNKEAIMNRLQEASLKYLCEEPLMEMIDNGSCYPDRLVFAAMHAVGKNKTAPDTELRETLVRVILADQPRVLKRLQGQGFMSKLRESKGEEKNKK